MSRRLQPSLSLLAMLVLPLAGCTSFREYVHNGFKVGPNYCRPPAQAAPHWIDAADQRIRSDADVPCHWWTLFNDPVLDHLIDCAYRQDLTLRQAGQRILQARADLAIAQGSIFPQNQTFNGSYRRFSSPQPEPLPSPAYFSQWNYNFNLNWELDFWGRFRRAIIAAEDTLDASIADYDDVLVTLLGDVAQNYVQMRTAQERIALLRANVELQRGVLNFIEQRFAAGFRVSELDVDQAKSNLAQTEAAIPVLQIVVRQSMNRLCTLLGMPTCDLAPMLGPGPIPPVPPEVAIGIPCDLLRRRPDVRRAERLAAAQGEQIGIAEAQLYPAFSINGTLGFQAAEFADLFNHRNFASNVGPSFNWSILNYGRIISNVRFQEARFLELVLAYQQSVLVANEEAENGIVNFLQSQEGVKLLKESVDAAKKAVNIVVLQYEKGAVDFNRYALIQQNLVTQQDQLAQIRGQVDQGLIQIYRALGGGWELRLEGPSAPTPPQAPFPPEQLPTEQLPTPFPAVPPVEQTPGTPPQVAPPGVLPNGENLGTPPSSRNAAPLPAVHVSLVPPLNESWLTPAQPPMEYPSIATRPETSVAAVEQ